MSARRLLHNSDYGRLRDVRDFQRNGGAVADSHTHRRPVAYLLRSQSDEPTAFRHAARRPAPPHTASQKITTLGLSSLCAAFSSFTAVLLLVCLKFLFYLFFI